MPFGTRPIITQTDAFAPDDWRMICALPLQIGRWMAELDNGGGPEAETAENEAMGLFLKTAQRKFEPVPLMGAICTTAQQHTVINPLREDVLFDRAREVIAKLRVHANVVEVNAYKLLLIEMAEHVARAAPDGDLKPHNIMNGARTGWFGLYPKMLDNVMRYNRGPQVSVVEKIGINRLINAVDAAHIVQKWVLHDGAKQNVRVYG
jgi:hypothetical protein